MREWYGHFTDTSTGKQIKKSQVIIQMLQTGNMSKHSVKKNIFLMYSYLFRPF